MIVGWAPELYESLSRDFERRISSPAWKKATPWRERHQCRRQPAATHACLYALLLCRLHDYLRSTSTVNLLYVYRPA